MAIQRTFIVSLPVAVNHLNYTNHLSFDALLTLLHEARLRWLKSINADLMEHALSENTGWLVKRVEVDYQSEAFYGEMLNITLLISNARRAGFTLHHVVTKQSSNEVIAKADVILVCIDTLKRKITRIPAILLSSDLFD